MHRCLCFMDPVSRISKLETDEKPRKKRGLYPEPCILYISYEISVNLALTYLNPSPFLTGNPSSSLALSKRIRQ